MNNFCDSLPQLIEAEKTVTEATAEQEQSPDPFLVLESPHWAAPRVFSQPNEALSWAENEQQIWQKFIDDIKNASGISPDGVTRSALALNLSAVSNLTNMLVRMITNQAYNENAYAGAVVAINSGKYLPTDSIMGQAVLRACELPETRPAAAALLAGATGWRSQNNDINMILTSSEIALATVNSVLIGAGEGDKHSAAAAEGEFRRVCQDWREKYRDLRAEADNAVLQMRGDLGAFADTGRNLFEHWAEKFEKQKEDHDERYQHIEAAFREHIRLKHLSVLWAEKYSSHRNAAWGWLAVFVAASVAGVREVIMNGPAYLEKLHKISGGAPQLVDLAAVSVPVLIVVWMMRHVSRMFVAHFHQAQDARQRSVMVQTYLSLIEQGAADEGERLLILQALFRPNSMKDDDDPGANALLEALVAKVKA